MLQKIIQVGNSAAITIPKDFLKGTTLKVGDRVWVETDNEEKTLTVKTEKGKEETKISKEFAAWTEAFINRNQPMLEELARK
ncbi:AbrB/MazE/SpoVT family DNA-binding domain-containing protein [Patescibacteria group bacterium]|nr:AbrB/MazE/SpoVT family DNA-binding domain-containing protein [Patescibacteria group bacterium]